MNVTKGRGPGCPALGAPEGHGQDGAGEQTSSWCGSQGLRATCGACAVPATQSTPAGTAQSLEHELLNLRMDILAGTFAIEGWEAVTPPLPEMALCQGDHPWRTTGPPLGVQRLLMDSDAGG